VGPRETKASKQQGEVNDQIVAGQKGKPRLIQGQMFQL